MDELDDPVRAALTTCHAHLAEVGTGGGAWRYPRDVSPFCAVESWDALASLARPGGEAVLFRAAPVEPPPGWSEEVVGLGHQLVLEGPLAAPEVGARRLGPDDVPAMLALTGATRPGPFLPRTIELGRFWGVESDGALVAMAGERLRLPGFTEISAVCTDPTWRGRGLAAGLTAVVAAAVLARGEVPFLHVADGNDAAWRLYDRLGFRYRTSVRFTRLRLAVTPPP